MSKRRHTVGWTSAMSLGAIGVFLLIFCSHLHAQDDKVIVLENANSLEGRIIDGEDARELIGDVRIRQGKVTIACDRALQFIQSGRVDLSGHVVVHDDSVTITAPRGRYYRDARRAEGFDGVTLDDGISHLEAEYGEYLVEEQHAFFRRRVVARDSASTLEADSAWYYRPDRRTVASGNVVIRNPADRLTITGGRFENFAAARFSRMSVDPILVQFDTSSSGAVDTLIVKSRIMDSYQDSVRRLLAIDSVRMVRTDFAGLAGFALLITEQDSIALRQSPVLWYQRTQLTGDSIDIQLRRRSLHRIIVMGNAFAVSQSDSLQPKRFDQLAGETLTLFFAQKALARIDVETRATSVYYVYDDSLPNGMNQTSGDKVALLFGDGKIRSIAVSGGVQGQYFPENLVRNREESFALPGFVWRNDRPRLRWRGDQHSENRRQP